MTRIELKNLSYTYANQVAQAAVLRNVSLAIESGELVALVGPSGSGKSTLVSLLGGMLRPPPESLYFDGIDVSRLTEHERALLRNQHLGFVFQQFHLVPRMRILDNILLPATCSPAGVAAQALAGRAKELASQFGVQDCLQKLPNQLSGGQQQRVAIARALLMNPRIIIADEPTGSLDSDNGREIMRLLEDANEAGTTVIIVTHDHDIAKRCPRIIEMRDGKVTADRSSDRLSGCATPHSRVLKDEGLPALQHTYRRNLLDWRSLSLVFLNLRRNWLRSLLTMLGVAVGIAAVLAMTTLGEYTKRSILSSYEILGANKISFRAWPNWEKKASDQVKEEFEEFTERDISTVASLFTDVEMLAPEITAWRSSALAGGLKMESINLRGVGAAYLTITNREIARGTGISARQVELASPVCVLGHEVVSQIFRRVEPLGAVLFINSGDNLFSCRVVGVLAHVSLPDAKPQPDEQVFIPYTYAQLVISNPWERLVSSVIGRVKSGTDVERLSKGIKSYFEVKYGKSVRFNVGGDEVLISQAKRFLSIFSLLLGSIAGVALLIAGTGLTNMMLVAVAERYREIGIRKAVGATDASIMRLFLGESISLCLVAGIFGLILGFAVYETLIWLASQATEKVTFAWILLPSAFGLSFVGIVAIGLLSGIVPAIRARRLQIVEALRSE